MFGEKLLPLIHCGCEASRQVVYSWVGHDDCFCMFNITQTVCWELDFALGAAITVVMMMIKSLLS